MAKKLNFDGLGKQFNDSVATKDAFSSAGGKTSSRVFNMKAIKGTEFLKMEKDNTYVIRFVPYTVDESHPKVTQGKLDVGDAAYVLDYTQHAVGINRTKVVCPHGTYGHSCPICDKHWTLKKEEADEKEISALKASRRVLYNVVLADKPSKLYLLDVSHYLFEKEILAELKKGNDDGEEYSIADFCVGASDGKGLALRVMVTEEKNGAMTFNKYAFKVVRNKYDVDLSVLEDAIPLHKAITELSSSELESLLYGASSDDEDEDDEDEEDYVPTVRIGNKEKTEEYGKKLFEDDDTDIPTAKEEDADDSDDGKKECPHGYDFGIDVNREDECDNCPLYEACYAEKKRMKSLRGK